MAKRSPWHSTRSEVYHDNTECNTECNNIESGDRRQAACQECARLSSQGR
jgi:hypothetical protein